MSVLWILGAGGHGRVVADAAAAAPAGRYDEIAFFDDDGSLPPRVGRWPVRGDAEAFLAAGAADVARHVAIGDNARRAAFVQRCELQGLRLATVVHPAAVVSAEAELAGGCFVAAGAVVAPGAALGAACIVNHGASVDHDVHLGRAVHVGPGARLGGGVTVGDEAWIGIGAVVRHGQAIGPGAVVGAGAVVVADVPGGACVVGNPARPLPAGPASAQGRPHA
ncbi:MAG: NeuD/PglB/VioB family sugar acetyltransferase [Rubrivivax sp.]|nr:NeuD/PglB/VioB family sugar acetyltransferase [Rubrivivax sp.]